MNYTKTNPIGLDAKIQSIQNKLYTSLNTLWGLSNGNEIDAYGRAYINQKDAKLLPEAYVGRNEYENVLVAERNKFFFLSRGIKEKYDTLRFKTNVELCFIVDLGQLKPDIEHRADSEVQNDVYNELFTFDNVFVLSLDTEIRSVFNGLSFDSDDNLQPYHCFKYNLLVIYAPDEVCDCGC